LNLQELLDELIIFSDTTPFFMLYKV
jgi:hypothetical protein